MDGPASNHMIFCENLDKIVNINTFHSVYYTTLPIYTPMNGYTMRLEFDMVITVLKVSYNQV